MKVILLSHVPHLGIQGDIKEVTNGYARNFLLPQKLAVIATPKVIASKKQWLAEMEVAKQSLVQQWNIIADAIRGKVISLSQKASPKGQLYAAVTAEAILPELTSLAGATIDAGAIKMKSPIKSLGTHEIEVYFSPDLLVSMQVVVTPIEEKEKVVVAKEPKKKRSSSKKDSHPSPKE